MEHISTSLPKSAAAAATPHTPTVSALLEDGDLVEMVYDSALQRTSFCVGGRDGARVKDAIVSHGHRLVPYAGTNNLLVNEVVLFPSSSEEYGTEQELVSAVQAFIHRYVDVSPLFERLTAYYVLLSWIYDSFNELPYLRLIGEPGSGKTRFLLTVGALCFKPIFASGASTVSPLFRLLDTFRGTLIVDEADFRFSDEKSEIVKILNNGNGRGFPVLRTEATNNGKEFNPKAYVVFGPKIVATRSRFQDPALESRCLTEEMGRRPIRSDIPINVPSEYKTEALHLRNQLLTFRFRHGGRPITIRETVDPAIEPRLNQVFAPLLSIIDDLETREELRTLARQYHGDLASERGQESESKVLEIIRDLRVAGVELSVKAITDVFQERHTADFDRKITPKWIGYLIRRKLLLRTRKRGGTYVLGDETAALLAPLFERYGIAETSPETQRLPASLGT